MKTAQSLGRIGTVVEWPFCTSVWLWKNGISTAMDMGFFNVPYVLRLENFT